MKEWFNIRSDYLETKTPPLIKGTVFKVAAVIGSLEFI